MSVPVMPFVWQTQVEKFVDSVDEVCSPISQSAHTEVVPATPVAGVILRVKLVVELSGVPQIPIHTIRDRLLLWITTDIYIVTVPTA